MAFQNNHHDIVEILLRDVTLKNAVNNEMDKETERKMDKIQQSQKN